MNSASSPIPKSPWVDLNVRPEQNAGVTQSADALVRRRRRQPDLRCDLFDRQPRIILQEAQNGDIHSVQIGIWRFCP